MSGDVNEKPHDVTSGGDFEAEAISPVGIENTGRSLDLSDKDRIWGDMGNEAVLFAERRVAYETAQITLDTMQKEDAVIVKESGFAASIVSSISRGSREALNFEMEVGGVHLVSAALGRVVRPVEMKDFESAFSALLKEKVKVVRIKDPKDKEKRRTEMFNKFINDVRELDNPNNRELDKIDELSLKNFKRSDLAYTKIAYQVSIAHKVVDNKKVMAMIHTRYATGLAAQQPMSSALMSQIVEEAIEKEGDPELKKSWASYKESYPPHSFRAEKTAARGELVERVGVKEVGASGVGAVPVEFRGDAEKYGAKFNDKSNEVFFGGLKREAYFVVEDNKEEPMVVIRDPNAQDGGERRVPASELATALHNIVVDDHFTKMAQRFFPAQVSAMAEHVKDASLFKVTSALFVGEEDKNFSFGAKQKDMLENLVRVLNTGGDSNGLGGRSGVAGLKERVRFMVELVQKPDVDKTRLRELFVDNDKKLNAMDWDEFKREAEGRSRSDTIPAQMVE